jgi:hypothetical protein
LFVISSSPLFNLPIVVFQQDISFSIIFRNVVAMLSLIVPLILHVITLDYFMKDVILTGFKG